jgi:hypothetical protein
MAPVILTFDYALFIQQVPQYSNPAVYSQALLQNYWDVATNYMSDVANYGVLQNGARQYGLNLFVAHLVYLAGLIAAGQVPGMMQTATIDKVSVGLTPPPLPNQFQWWLGLTPYGQQLLALLQIKSVGGFYIGGSPTIGNFANGRSRVW